MKLTWSSMMSVSVSSRSMRWARIFFGSGSKQRNPI